MTALAGQVALVTGCARLKGIGRAAALALAGAGADVVISDITSGGTRNAAEHGEAEAGAGWHGLRSLAEEITALGRKAVAVEGDVSNHQDVEQIFGAAVGSFGKVDVLINNASAPLGPDRHWTWELPVEQWDTVMKINAKGAFLMSAEMARHLLQRGEAGRIVNVSSIMGKRGGARRAAYAASKFAIIGLTESLAVELAPHGITVNAVCPGDIDTARRASRTARPPSGQPASAKPPVGRAGLASEVARTILFLADPEAGFITGEAINVDGGALLV
jgi:3-oxoacyl-[acyl-carrier protein] reductase